MKNLVICLLFLLIVSFGVNARAKVWRVPGRNKSVAPY